MLPHEKTHAQAHQMSTQFTFCARGGVLKSRALGVHKRGDYAPPKVDKTEALKGNLLPGQKGRNGRRSFALFWGLLRYQWCSRAHSLKGFCAGCWKNALQNGGSRGVRVHHTRFSLCVVTGRRRAGRGCQMKKRGRRARVWPLLDTVSWTHDGRKWSVLERYARPVACMVDSLAFRFAFVCLFVCWSSFSACIFIYIYSLRLRIFASLCRVRCC